MHEEIWRHLRGAIWAQSTNQPPWIQIFPTQPCICIIFSIRIGLKAMTLGGDSSKAAIARSADILTSSVYLMMR